METRTREIQLRSNGISLSDVSPHHVTRGVQTFTFQQTAQRRSGCFSNAKYILAKNMRIVRNVHIPQKSKSADFDKK